MLEQIIQFSIRNKLIVLIFTTIMVGFGIFSLVNIPIGAVPDITNNQVQVITTSRNLATQDVEKFLTYPVELEMANLPGVIEIRSVSKFGLSVVTVVFEDKMGTYLPRQLIAEKIKSAEETIPSEFGKPFMGPVSTGLGEIYQYIIDVDPEYKDEYSITDLRTIQDWIVKRQLSGIPGVVEVNTWGGFLKQYEVAINPEQLSAINLTLSDVFEALEKNNSVAGGSYIEKGNESFFIRGEGLVGSLEDIENIVVTNRNGTPIFIRDVAKVGFGHANRFGAITGNGEGEKVLGQVMMLKDADSKAVIDAVKARVLEIEASLPPGVKINAFLERSELIGKTTFTIAENLILGCLIVIFVVVLLLGNLRSGLVVASVIPLCLLFALSLMYIFGVDANLMSLGAIDFGIIIDGAVIIVEYIAFKITSERTQIMALPKDEKQGLIDKITFGGATKMMRSAVFGQLIIIIVFIPILSLSGVEGKMFKPMAMVFCFALIGAMILCFTYVPVVASMFLKPSDPSKKNISNTLIGFLERIYTPTITWALKSKGIVLAAATALLIVVGVVFSKMGGEFVPVLDEGDFVIQPVLKTGTSLSKTIEATTQMEQILKKFPEVDQVVTRIGAAEVPTDPMSMEESDVIIKLRPIKEWTSAETKDELADKFKEALSAKIPGVEFEFTQPIEMRFNELITGVRADLAIKVFGEDLDVLYQKSLEIERAIRNVEGAADIIVEKVAGLPQMSVIFNRQKIARYGLNVEELNDIITMGFAGKTAGSVFEGEKQFDLAVRYAAEYRKDIQDIARSLVSLPNGNKVPLGEFAEISYTKGPAKISRDDTKRRVVVGVNVRGRDLESVVKDVQKIIKEEVKIPVGYNVEYGGQFENLRSAKARLLIAVPIALILIFILLYFAFHSVKEALMIYSAIPLSAVGGVLLLYFRDMPFSISAGVGFIALFGIAVLNGIVLIEHFKELKSQGHDNIHDRIIKGTKERLRPVLLTATAAAFGFLPMAISTNAGAEVQRPLATVVIGGLISATILTLIVLPVLYSIFNKNEAKKPMKIQPLMIVILLMFALNTNGKAQTKPISLNEAINIALKNNNELKASSAKVAQSKSLVNSALDLDKTQVYYHFDENNLAVNNQALNVFGVSQSFALPSVYGSQKKVLEGLTSLSEQQNLLDQNRITKEVSKAYYTIIYWQNVRQNYTYLDSLYKDFSRAALRKFEEGESNYLEKLTAEAKQRELDVALKQSGESVKRSYALLHQWLQSDTEFQVEQQEMVSLEYSALDTSNHLGIQYFEKAELLSQRSLKLAKQQMLPDLHLNIFRGSNNGPSSKAYMGFQAGVGIPLFMGADKAKVNAAKIQTLISEYESENYRTQLKANFEAQRADLKQYEEAINYYETAGKLLSQELINNGTKAFKSGEIDFLQYIQLLDNAKSIEITYLENLYSYNMILLDIKYLTTLK
ncbi:CusA/CzcA family heavy metal efflux RND transporter [Roseivirga echinicomitans]